MKELIQEADEFTRRNAQVRSQISEKQRKVSSLEVESATLSQVISFFSLSFLIFILSKTCVQN